MGLLIPPPRFAPPTANYSGRPVAAWGRTISGSGTAHVLGAITEILASTPRPANRIRVAAHGSGGSALNSDRLLNIYLGTSGAEILVIPGMLVGWRAWATADGAATSWTWPIHIPRGSRISGATQGAQATHDTWVQVDLWWEDAWAGSRVETLGVVTGSSRGTTITPGTTVEGTWTAIGTTTRRWRAAMLDLMGNVDTSLTAQRMAGDVGAGGAAVAGLEDWDFTSHTTEYWFHASERFRSCDIAPGTALQARIQSHTSDVEAKSAVIHGVY